MPKRSGYPDPNFFGSDFSYKFSKSIPKRSGSKSERGNSYEFQIFWERKFRFQYYQYENKGGGKFRGGRKFGWYPLIIFFKFFEKKNLTNTQIYFTIIWADEKKKMISKSYSKIMDLRMSCEFEKTFWFQFRHSWLILKFQVWNWP